MSARPLEIEAGAGWIVARYHRVHCTYVGSRVSDSAYAELMDSLARDIDGRRVAQRIGVLYFTPETAEMDSPRRRRIAQVLNDRKDKLQQTTAAFALATHSPFVRGVLNTLFWMAPPGYPYKVVATPEDGLRFIAEYTSIDPVDIAESFEALVREQLRAAS
jgi:hypothetical protein